MPLTGSGASPASSAECPDEPELNIPEPPWPAPLGPDALYGLAGDVVKEIGPQTEADPAAVLVQFLVGFGNMAGRHAYYMVEDARHSANLFAVLVGQTSRARKGTSWQRARWVLERGGDEKWADDRIVSGLSSGEGLIWEVRDPLTRRVKNGSEYHDEEVDPGIDDKRVLVVEEEFARVLAVGKREGNILGSVLRSAWDSGELRSMTKNTPARCKAAHISIISHITRRELLDSMQVTQAHNGFLNRFLWVAVRRSKLLPHGGEPIDVAPLAERLEAAWRFASGFERQVKMTQAARDLWGREYSNLTADRAGLFGLVTSRAEAQVLRLSLIYSLLDRDESIDAAHLTAALGVMRYVEESARHVFGDATGDPLADAIDDLLRTAPGGIGQLDLIHHFDRHKSKAELARALGQLVAAGRVRSEKTATGGRPRVTWYRCEQSEVSEQSTAKG